MVNLTGGEAARGTDALEALEPGRVVANEFAPHGQPAYPGMAWTGKPERTQAVEIHGGRILGSNIMAGATQRSIMSKWLIGSLMAVLTMAGNALADDKKETKE